MACPDGDALHVQDLRNVVWMDAVEVEGDDAGAALRCRAVGDQTGDVRHPLERIDEQFALVLLDRVESDVGDVIDGGSETDRFRDRLGAGLELVRDLPPGRLLELDRADHVAPEVEGGHGLQQLAAPPERSYARRPAHLV